MFEFQDQKNEPVAISAFGSQSRLALSPDIQAGSSREVAARGAVITTQVVRRPQLQSTFSAEGFSELDSSGRQAVVEHLVNPQLRSLNDFSPPDHLVSAAVMLLAMSQPQQALELLSKVSDQKHYWTHHYRAISLWKLQRPDEAKALLRKLISESPSDPRPAHALGRLLLLENKNDEAWAVFQELTLKGHSSRA